jgi:hypothetical protein
MIRDKKSLILVCKEFAFVCTPFLYKHMAVSIKTMNNALAPVLWNHRGLVHIRTLSVGGGVNRTGNFHIPTHDRIALRRILSAIPENVLTKFRYCYSVASA